MKTKKKNIPKLILFFISMVVVLSIVFTSVLLLRNSSSYFTNEAQSLATEYTRNTVESIAVGATSSFDFVQDIANRASFISGFDAMDAFGEEQVKKYDFSCLQFINETGVEYRYGESVGDYSSPVVQKIIYTGTLTCSDIFDDSSLGTSCIAVYCPVVNNPDITGVLAYKDVAKIYHGKENLHETVRFYCLAEADGKMLEQFVREDFPADVSHNVFSYLMNVSNDKAATDAISKDAERKIPSAHALTVGGEEYVVAVLPILNIGADCMVVNVYLRHDLLSGEYSLYDKLLVMLFVMILLTVVTIAVSYIVSRVNAHKVTIIDELDPLLGCNTFNKFMQEAQNIVARNRFSKFAVGYLTIKNYVSFCDNFDKPIVDDTLNHITNVLKKSIAENETFGHIIDDRFVFMVHYTDVNNLSDKIKIISALIAYFDKLKMLNYSLSVSMGIYLTRENSMHDEESTVGLDMNDCVNRAKIANLAHAKAYEKPFIIYDSSIGSTYVEDAKVEGKMQAALDNREFRLFFQPKYNINQNNLDSAEVLVRWYNEETKVYQSPASFIRIFETNGFIIKLDHYVFRESCDFLKKMKETGQKTVPLSVNVSRVTAIEPNFIEFYKEVKDEFGIPDGYITLEFTETFAYDSYETLSRLVINLKRCGFLCSIDDFGVGYSALNILKELPVDEIKIDKELLQVGNDPQKDKVILEGIFQMAKQLGLKLIQEGVETKEELNYIHELGCNIIQGYYYSKPLYMTDFVDFINDSRLSKLLKL